MGCKLTGTLTPIGTLSGTLTERKGLLGKLAMAVSEVIIDHSEHYEGQYTVTPSASTEIVLETADKVMDANVTVREIPFYKTSNVADGYTAYIGTEVI